MCVYVCTRGRWRRRLDARDSPPHLTIDNRSPWVRAASIPPPPVRSPFSVTTPHHSTNITNPPFHKTTTFSSMANHPPTRPAGVFQPACCFASFNATDHRKYYRESPVLVLVPGEFGNDVTIYYIYITYIYIRSYLYIIYFMWKYSLLSLRQCLGS